MSGLLLTMLNLGVTHNPYLVPTTGDLGDPLFLFLDDPKIPATNNTSEQALR